MSIWVAYSLELLWIRLLWTFMHTFLHGYTLCSLPKMTDFSVVLLATPRKTILLLLIYYISLSFSYETHTIYETRITKLLESIKCNKWGLDTEGRGVEPGAGNGGLGAARPWPIFQQLRHQMMPMDGKHGTRSLLIFCKAYSSSHPPVVGDLFVLASFAEGWGGWGETLGEV